MQANRSHPSEASKPKNARAATITMRLQVRLEAASWLNAAAVEVNQVGANATV